MIDLLIENARVRDREEPVSVLVNDGTIERIDSSASSPEAGETIDADGRLVTPTYTNPHIHLDQIYTWPPYPNEEGTFSRALRSNQKAKEEYTVEGILERLDPALTEAVRYGNTLMRGFADVDDHAGLTGLKALLEAKQRYRDRVDLQVCAFAQEGMGEHLHPEGEAWLRKAAELEPDILGGIPWIEQSDEEMKAHVDTVFDVAKDLDVDVHFLVDDTDTPTSRSLEYVALKTLREGYEGRVACSHARSLAAYDDYHAEKVIDLVRQADIHILSNMHIVLFLGAHRDREPIRRGITRVKELLEAGVNVSIAQDDVYDMWYPFGTNDMLELGWFACHAAKFSSLEEIETAYDMITTNGAEAMGLSNHGIEEGTPANLVVLEADSVLDAFRTRAERRWVIKDGRIVSRSETSTTVEGP